mmetsp:Transcript_36167/g.104053  ORF Transcript_36167/g.104053 Transcript_36167/m.104053 type:complete len:221 (+) Transcript_36167:388-1050(+)
MPHNMNRLRSQPTSITDAQALPHFNSASFSDANSPSKRLFLSQVMFAATSQPSSGRFTSTLPVPFAPLQTDSQNLPSSTLPIVSRSAQKGPSSPIFLPASSAITAFKVLVKSSTLDSMRFRHRCWSTTQPSRSASMCTCRSGNGFGAGEVKLSSDGHSLSVALSAALSAASSAGFRRKFVPATPQDATTRRANDGTSRFMAARGRPPLHLPSHCWRARPS